MSPEEIKTLGYPYIVNRYLVEGNPTTEYVYNEVEKHPNLNLYFLWSEYKGIQPWGDLGTVSSVSVSTDRKHKPGRTLSGIRTGTWQRELARLDG